MTRENDFVMLEILATCPQVTESDLERVAA